MLAWWQQLPQSLLTPLVGCDDGEVRHRPLLHEALHLSIIERKQAAVETRDLLPVSHRLCTALAARNRGPQLPNLEETFRLSRKVRSLACRVAFSCML